MLKKQLLDSTRGRIVALLRGGRSTADEIASQLGLTRSAVRAHITGMERDAVVRRAGRRPGATRPSHLFELTPEAEETLSRAYVPLLAKFLEVVTARIHPDRLESVMRETGARLADELCGGKRPTGNLVSRAAVASEMLNEQLGATTRVDTNGPCVIRGAGCPLSAVAGKHPGICLAMESLIAEVTGARVRECCDRSERPRCCFEIRNAAAGRRGAVRAARRVGR